MKINEFTNALESKYGISIEDTSTRRLTESVDCSTLECKLSKFLKANGYKADPKYVSAAADYIERSNEMGDPLSELLVYTVEQWFEDTEMNYPEDLELEESCKKSLSESHLSQELDEALIDYDEIEFMDDAEVEDFLWDRLNDAEYEVMSELGMMIEPSGHGSTGAFFIFDEETGRELAVIDFQDYNDKELELSSECDDINQYKEKYKAWVEGFKDVEEALTKVNESHTITEDIGDKYKVVYTPYERYTSSGVLEESREGISIASAVKEAMELDEAWNGRVPISIIREESDIPEDDVKSFCRWLNSTDETSGFDSLESFLDFCDFKELYHRYLEHKDYEASVEDKYNKILGNPIGCAGKGITDKALGYFKEEEIPSIIDTLREKNLKYIEKQDNIGHHITAVGEKKDMVDFLLTTYKKYSDFPETPSHLAACAVDKYNPSTLFLDGDDISQEKIATAYDMHESLMEGKEPPIRKVLEANDIMATLDKDPQGTLEKAIQLVKESDVISEKDKYTFAQAVGTGPISKRVSSLASYFYDVQRVGKRR